MEKIIDITWDFGESIIAPVKIGSVGVTRTEERFLEKRASADFASKVRDRLTPSSGEEYVHVIALGAHEYYGPNRKGDTFTEDVCRKYHKTFEKYAKWYRDHRNGDPSRSYGVVKIAHYDEVKKRIDLIVALNATQKAAQKNGGLIADKELDILYSGEAIPVSMSCLVSYDICSGCGHKAKSAHDRCGPIKCAKYGGCATNMGRTFADGHTLCVFNPDPVFFDISYVRVPADRVAYSVGLLKSPNVPLSKLADASLHNIIYKAPKSASWQDDFHPENIVLDGEMAVLRKLARHDRVPQWAYGELASAFSPLVRKCAEFGIQDPYGFLSAAYGSACLLPPEVFFAKVYPLIRGHHVKNAYVDVADAFSYLMYSPNASRSLAENPYIVRKSATAHDINIVREHAPYWSLDDMYTAMRVSKAKALGWSGQTKCAAYKDPELAREYALYALAFLYNANYPNDAGRVICATKSWYLS